MGGDQPFVGMIIVVPFTFAPAGWMFCQGQIIAIAENETLFNLIGTTFGGDGQSTFALPNLQSRVAPHTGGGLNFADTGGVEQVTLTVNQIPLHNHSAMASTQAANSAIPNGAVLASAGPKTYDTQAPDSALAAGSLTQAGGNQPHDNIKPYLALNFIIAMYGIYPSQN